jgi:DNA-binding SARP family transcriptional activator
MEAAMQTALQFVLQRDKSQAEIALIEAQTSKVQAEQELVERQTLNAIEEGKVLIAQECKLRAEYDVLMQTKLKTGQETELLLWKVNTEKAQTVALGVDPDSVIGKQKILYQAQATGFERDAEQKAAKLMIDSWNVRRTTDEATVADTTNMLNDAAVGRAVQKLLNGVGA